MGSRVKKALVPESVRELLHNWCKRVKARSKRESLHSHTTRSVCSLESAIYEGDQVTIASGTLSRSSSFESQNQLTVTSNTEAAPESVNTSPSQQSPTDGEEASLSIGEEEQNVKTLFELFEST